MPASTPPSDRQLSSMESFLDEYQTLRLFLSVAGLVVMAVFEFGGWSTGTHPAARAVVLASIAGHAAWCRFRHVRAPRTMLVMDITLLGALMFTLPQHPSVITGMFGFLALIVVLFAQTRWMVGFLAYLTAWYVAAFLTGSAVSVETMGTLVGSLFMVTAVVAVMTRVRGWLGRLDGARSQMIGTVSHELRNNLTGVLGLTEVVATMPDLEPDEARELVTMAHQQAVDANEIVEDLLTASRVSRAALTIDVGLVDVNAEVVTVARRFHQADNEIHLMLSEDLPSAWADSLRVRQTIRNLLSNAIRYGGSQMTLLTRQTGDAIQITVRDDGEGVPRGEEDTIFLPYRRSTEGRRDTSSIGLGLWISRNVAEAMGGHLEYQRRNGFTEFILTLPTASPDQETATASASSPVPGRAADNEPPGWNQLVRRGVHRRMDALRRVTV